MEDQEVAPTTYRFEFHGKAGEYFGIWIVNLLLTIVTLGIYSAWAKVRTKRYFYGNTSVAGSAFEYTAVPRKILAGRVIAVGMLAIYQVSIQFFDFVSLYLLVVFLLAIPFFYVASTRFRMRYSQWRGINFNFRRDYRGAYLLFSPVLVYLLLVSLSPYFFDLPTADTATGDEASGEPAVDFTGYLIYTSVLTLCALVFFPLWQRFYYLILGNRVRYGHAFFTLQVGTGRFYSLNVAAFGIVFIGLFVTGVLLAIYGDSLLEGDSFISFFLVTYGTLLIFYVLSYALYQTRLTNLLYSNIRLAGIEFESSLEFLPLLRLYVVNALAIIGSVGMAIPWAKIRAARYRADHMLMRATNLDQFLAHADAEVDAAGDAISDIFDLDIGL